MISMIGEQLLILLTSVSNCFTRRFIHHENPLFTWKVNHSGLLSLTIVLKIPSPILCLNNIIHI